MISENKLKHSLGVARECANLAKQFGLSEDQIDACFLMGFLHDIGYEKDPSTSHTRTGADLIRNFIFFRNDCLNAISSHGFEISSREVSIFDKILNIADLTTSFDGSSVTMEERLEGIKSRYGEDSEHYRNALRMIEIYKED